MSREAEQKVLGSIAEYIETLIKKIEDLEVKVERLAPVHEEHIAAMIGARLDDYDPWQHVGFKDAVDDRISEVLPDMISDMEFSATITANRRGRRY